MTHITSPDKGLPLSQLLLLLFSITYTGCVAPYLQRHKNVIKMIRKNRAGIFVGDVYISYIKQHPSLRSLDTKEYHNFIAAITDEISGNLDKCCVQEGKNLFNISFPTEMTTILLKKVLEDGKKHMEVYFSSILLLVGIKLIEYVVFGVLNSVLFSFITKVVSKLFKARIQG